MYQNDIKLPPHSIEAEQSVIGGILIAPSAWDDACAILSENDFYRHEHKLIWLAFVKLAEQSKPMDVITVCDAMEAAGELEKVGGLSYLGDLARNVPSAANIICYCNIVRDNSILRELIAIGMQITKDAYHRGTPAVTIAEDAESRLFAMMQAKDSREPVTLEKAMEEAIVYIENRYSGIDMAMPTGLTDLDGLLGGGLHKGSLNIIGARPKMGKTSLACSIALSAAKTGGSIYFASLEMPRREIANRMITITAGCQANSVMDDNRALDVVTDAVGYLRSRNIIIDDECSITISKLRSRCRKVQRKYGLNMVVVDYLQLMRGEGDTREQEVSSISRGLKALAKELDCPVLCLAQLNRECESRLDKRPHMGDLRESGAIEADADLVMMLYRDEVYNKETQMKGVAEILIRANRHGPAGDVFCQFDGHLTRFGNLDKHWSKPIQEKKGRGL